VPKDTEPGSASQTPKGAGKSIKDAFKEEKK